MRRKILICVFALLLLSFTSLPVVVPGSLALAHSDAGALPIPTPTLDPVQILSTANAVATQAADAVTKSDSASSTVNTVASDLNIGLVLFGVIVAVFTLVATILAAVGINLLARINKKIAQVDDAVKKAQEARQDLATALQSIDPKVGELRKEVIYLLRGYQLLELKKKDQAVKAFQRALELRPEDSQANYALGRIYSGDKIYTKAISCFRTSLNTDSHFSEALMELGLTLRRQADQIFEEAKKGRTEEQMGSEWGQAIKQRNDRYFEAIRVLKEANEALPGDEDILGALGGIYRRQGDYQTALIYYQESLDANPDSSYALGNVASLSYHLAKQQKASEAFEKTLALATKRIEAQSSRESWWDHYDRGMARLVLSQIGEDCKEEEDKTYEQDYKKAIELTPNSESFESVLNGLYFLKEAESKYNPPKMQGLDDMIEKVREAKEKMEAKEREKQAAKEKVGDTLATVSAVAVEASPAKTISAAPSMSTTLTETPPAKTSPTTPF
jgi:tetratricopeptide (TPR) repeat protein